jgi:hypothetical protein
MAENVTLAPLATLQNSSIIATVNANNLLIETAFADCVSLSGTSPNSMLSNLDMNGFNIINLPAPSTVNSPVRVTDLGTSTLNPALFGLLGGINTWTGSQNFSGGGIFQDNLTIESVTGTGTPNIILYNGFTAAPGSFVGSGLIFNCNNAAGAFHTAAFINGGYVDNTTGHERGLIDFEVYQGFTATNKIVTLACNDSSFWFAPGTDNSCSLGLSSFRWTNIYSLLFTGPGGTAPIFTTTASITSGAGVGTGTLTNAPASSNPTKWIPINDNGTTRYIPAW